MQRQLPEIERRIRQRDRTTPLTAPIGEPYSETMLATMVARQDRVSKSSRIGTDYVHVSSLKDLCPRQNVLAEGKEVTRTRPTSAQRVLWEIGLAIERHVVNNIITDRKRHGVLGRWECPCGHHVFTGLWSPAYGKCVRCQCEPTIYKQMVLEDHDAKIKGSPDLCFFTNENRLLITEVKSMTKDDFDPLTEPLPDHQFQAHGYRRLAIKNGYPVMPAVAFFYVRKEFKFSGVYKEYHMPETPMVGRLLDASWADAERVKRARELKVLPASLSVCRRPDTTRARNCPVVTACFNRR